MHESTALAPRRVPAPRRLILGTALVLALAVGLAPKTPAVGAQESPPPAGAPTPAPKPAGADPHGVAIRIGIDAGSDSATGDGAGDRAGATAKVDPGTPGGQRTITVTKNGKTVTVTGAAGDRELESFGEFVHNEPAMAFMVVGVIAVVFLSPVLAIALILGYRMRKVRMQNETMLKLAEKGVLAPGEAIAAVAAGTLPPEVAADGGARAGGAASTPVERVAAIRRRAAWSDLRKGVVMGGIGLGLSLFSLLDDRSANSIGLVLLFVGIGYVVLWWFEERQAAPRDGAGGTTPGSGPGGSL